MRDLIAAWLRCPECGDTLLGMLFRTHAWDEALERIDARGSSRAFGSSNIAVVATKAAAK